VLSEIKAKKYYLSGRFKNTYLTKREAESIICLARGLSIKQIGKVLGVSDRTVESCIDILKTKLNCHHRSELIEIAIECGFLEGIRPVIVNK